MAAVDSEVALLARECLVAEERREREERVDRARAGRVVSTEALDTLLLARRSLLRE